MIYQPQVIDLECAKCKFLFILQKTYTTLDEHKEGMRRHLRAWNAPSLERLIEATKADSILLSNIYQRQVSCRAAIIQGLLHAAPRIESPAQLLLQVQCQVCRHAAIQGRWSPFMQY